MRHTTLDVIHDEHQSLAAMLRSLSLLLMQSRRDSRLPDFEVMRAMLFYIDEFADRQHHRKESALLFPAVLRRCPELAPVMERLEHEHDEGNQAIREIEHALLAFEMMGEARRAAFEHAAEGYTRFYLGHMALEESEILPAAKRALLPEDWAPLDADYAAHAQAQARAGTRGADSAAAGAADDYRPLFRRILERAPAPIGLG